MEKIIFRKFLYDLLTFFIIVSLSLSLITWIIQSVNYLDFISKDGHGFNVYFSFISLNFPKIFAKLISFSFFVSLFFIIKKYQSNNEILIFWTNGINKIKLINFIIKISIFVVFIQILLSYFFVPKVQDQARDFLRNSNVDLFSSLITEKKFIDTVKNFTIFVDSIDENGTMKNIFIKDSVNENNTQIISAKTGKIIESGTNKYFSLNYGQILDVNNDNLKESKVIKFNNTIFNISKFKTKSTIFPKIQELDSNILISCANNYFFGNRQEYNLPIFQCSEQSSLKGFKEVFDRSVKQLYTLILVLIASMLLFNNDRNPKFYFNNYLIFFVGILFIIFSEITSEFLNVSILNNIIFIFLPTLIFVFTYLIIIRLNKKNF